MAKGNWVVAVAKVSRKFAAPFPLYYPFCFPLPTLLPLSFFHLLCCVFYGKHFNSSAWMTLVNDTLIKLNIILLHVEPAPPCLPPCLPLPLPCLESVDILEAETIKTNFTAALELAFLADNGNPGLAMHSSNKATKLATFKQRMKRILKCAAAGGVGGGRAHAYRSCAAVGLCNIQVSSCRVWQPSAASCGRATFQVRRLRQLATALSILDRLPSFCCNCCRMLKINCLRQFAAAPATDDVS